MSIIKGGKNFLIFSLLINMALIINYKLTKEELSNLENIHPSFLQTSNKSKIKANLSNTKNNISMVLKSCSCNSSIVNKCGGTGNPYDDPSMKNSSSQPSSKSSDDEKSEGTGACSKDNKATNALGNIGPKIFAITKSPYKVFTCDQVLVIEAQTFANQNNYAERKPAVFTLSIYMINQFDKKDGKTMTNHMLLNDIKEIPSEIYGAPNCIGFKDSLHMNKIVICHSENTVKQIKNAFLDFMKCRMGDNLKGISSINVKKVFKAACLGNVNGYSGDEIKLINFLKPFLPEDKNSDHKQLRGTHTSFYGLKIPGSDNY